MDTKTLLITGGTGFIGKHLCDHLESKNYSVYLTTQKPAKRTPQQPNTHFIHYQMGTPFPWDQIPKIDYIIHLAWDMNPKNSRRNISSTIDLATAGIQNGVAEQIFFSSFSSHESALSKYGSAKFEVEKFFIEHGLKICRPGLVVGDGGVYKKMSSTIFNHKIIPLIDGGTDIVPTIDIDSLCELTKALLTSKTKTGNFFDKEKKSLKAVLDSIALDNLKSPLFVYVPSRLLLPFVLASEKMGITLPISSENIYGMIANRMSPHESNVDDFKVELRQ